MAYKFSNKSISKIDTCHPLIREWVYKAMEYQRFDITIIEGHRSDERQDELKRQNLSRLSGGQSKHNHFPSLAIDLLPSPTTKWEDIETFKRFGEFMIGVAAGLNMLVRWGGDWDMDGKTNDQKFNDYVHFELII